jgi:hypothetical protein
MKRYQRHLPEPVTEVDKSFMAHLLAGVRAKREQAIGGALHPPQTETAETACCPIQRINSVL